MDDVEDSSDQELSTTVTHKESDAPQNKMRQFCINGREEPCSPSPPSACRVQASRDGWRDGGEEKYGTEENLLDTGSPAEGTLEEPCSPLSDYWVYLNEKHNSFDSTVTSNHDFVTTKSPMNYTEGVTSFSGPETDQASVSHSSECGDVSGADLVVVTAAAHLHLMGDSLALIGHELQETDKAVCASSSMSLLMDSMLCALVPLVSLTALMPEFSGVPQHTLVDAMENIAYMMPGL
ncbi:unnamed protein product [Gadus morhua 'NCC']